MKTNFFTLLIVLSFFSLSNIAKAESADDNLVSLKLSCKEAGPDCSKVIDKSTGREILVQNKFVLNLSDIKSATVTVDEAGTYGLKLKFKNPTALKNITTQNIGLDMAIFINGDLTMAPKIIEPINGDEVIAYGQNITREVAHSTADKINQAIETRDSGSSK